MRFLRSLLLCLAVLVLGVLLTPAQAWARCSAGLAAAQQGSATAGGAVVQVGFDGKFQPSGWVPMKVRVNPPGGESGLFYIRVHQVDLDGDEVVFQRSITLTGGMTDQEFWTYFKPQPVNALAEQDSQFAREHLRVVLAGQDGRELAQLSLGVRLEPLYSSSQISFNTAGRGKRLVLCVSESGGVYLGHNEYADVVGMTEDIEAVGLTPAELPDRAIGYESVDAIVWQDADPAVLAAGAGERMSALRQWVQGGGKLIVTARSEWQSLEPFFDILPVTPTGSVELDNLMPLQSIVLENLGRSLTDRAALVRAWRAAPGPFRYILGDAQPDAIVEYTFAYEQESELGGSRSGEAPFLARRPEGFGSVTFVALDFSNRNLRGRNDQPTPGWSILWNKVLGLGDQPLLDPRPEQEADHELREQKDLGYALLPGSRLAGRSVALVTVALVFFIVYWLVAGPGLFFYLAARKRTPLSWYFFGAAAVVATFVTLGVVKLILRGPPDLRHVSIARQGPVAPQRVHSEMGLYIPEDGLQRIVVDNGAAGTLPTLTGLAIDPEQHLSAGNRSNPISYTISLDPPDRGIRGVDGAAAMVEIPYRSTLKKLEADWIGPTTGGIGGEPRLVPSARTLCEGRLTNLTGQDLLNVHIAFRWKVGAQDEVYIVYLPTWLKGQTLQGIDTLRAPTDPNQRPIRRVDRNVSATTGPPSQTDAVYGDVRTDWANYWYSYLRTNLLAPSGSSIVDDWPERIRRTPAMLSFFSLLPPMRREAAGSADPTRLLRRGARELDLSAAVMAGHMVIIAEAEEVALPIPMEVDGDKVEGAGRVIYQFVLPLDRSEIARYEQEQRRAATQQSTPEGADAPPADQ